LPAPWQICGYIFAGLNFLILALVSKNFTLSVMRLNEMPNERAITTAQDARQVRTSLASGAALV
jgi:hypothetical protein